LSHRSARELELANNSGKSDHVDPPGSSFAERRGRGIRGGAAREDIVHEYDRPRDLARGGEDAGDVAPPLGAREPTLPPRRPPAAETRGDRQLPTLGQSLGKLPGRMMPAVETAIEVRGDEGDHVHGRRRNDLDHDLDGGPGEPSQRALLPTGDEGAYGVVVRNGRPDTRECEPPPGALAATPHRPSRRRAAALAERRLDPR